MRVLLLIMLITSCTRAIYVNNHSVSSESIELCNDGTFVYMNKRGKQKIRARGEYYIDTGRIEFKFNRLRSNSDLLPIEVLKAKKINALASNDRRIAIFNKDGDAIPFPRITLNPGRGDELSIAGDLNGEVLINEKIEVKELEFGNAGEISGRITVPNVEWNRIELVYKAVFAGGMEESCFGEHPIRIMMRIEGDKLVREDTNEEYELRGK